MKSIVSLFHDTKKVKKEKSHPQKQVHSQKRSCVRTPHWRHEFLIIFIGTFFFFSPVRATLPSDLHLTIDKTTGSTDDIFTLEISLKKASHENYFSLENMEIPGIENFQVMGSSMATNIKMINGSTAAVSEKKIMIQPLHDGTFSIGPIKMHSDSGSIVESESITITVEKSVIQKTKESLLKPIQAKEKIDTTPTLHKNISLNPNNSSTKEKVLPSFLKNNSYTNWFFWGQLFAGFFLFFLGIWVGRWKK